jgi:ABC-type dipeptide/oligopeptide/nickel transport system ATPase component
MQGTRVKILKELETWASNANSSKVYWMVGMAGIGKSTIAHTFCENLEAKNILGGSFFASRASEKTRNARLIIPVIAYALAKASPRFKVEVVKAIEDDPTLAEPTYININEQFKQLIYNPLRTTAGEVDKLYKVVVIDAVDECDNLEVVASFIKLVLEWASKIPLKIFIASRDEYRIRNAFGSTGSVRFYLHEIEKDVVENDIRKYVEVSLARIKDHDSEEWPLSSEVSGLVERSGTLFIYAATAVRYITNGGQDYKSRLSALVIHGQTSINKFETDIDSLYVHVLEKACEDKELHEVAPMRDLLSVAIFLRKPLPMEAITSLSLEQNAHSYLSGLTSVIHIPNQPGAVVAPFHASFPDFITNPDRCSPKRCPLFHSLVASEGHQLIALKCLKLMNRSLKYNICDMPKELTVSRRERANSPENVGKISEALKYSCIYWADHLAEVKVFDAKLIGSLRVFLHEHLLHWIECISILNELHTGVKSLGGIVSVLLVSYLPESRRKHYESNDFLVERPSRCMTFSYLFTMPAGVYK